MRSDLRIIGPEVTPPDFLTLRPSFSANVTPGGVHIPWKFDGNSKWLEVLRLEVDSSDGKGFLNLKAGSLVSVFICVVAQRSIRG